MHDIAPPETIAETKAVSGPVSLDMIAAHEGAMRLFEAYKETNERRLAEVEKRAADVVTEDKLARLNDALDAKMARMERLALDARRPALALEPRRAEPSAHKAAFEAYIRKGDMTGYDRLETRALSFGSGPDGGFIAPPEVETSVTMRMSALSPIRAIAGVRQVSAPSFKRPFARTGMATGWVGETANRTVTDSPVLAEQVFPTMELYAMPAATQALLDDAAVDLEEWIGSEVETVFAEQESKAFVTGDGTNKPTGFLASVMIANASWEWGKLGYVATGAAADFPSSNPTDVMLDLVYGLKAGYRQNGRFVMNRKTQAQLRKFKDAGGSYVWLPPAQPGGEASLFNFPVTESEDMPNVGANAFPIAFGDFRRGYLIVDRMGVRILRDPYSSKPYVLFYTTKRVGGGVADFDAIKLIKVATS